jgi:hypothetical protein
MELDRFDFNDPKQFFEELVKKALEGKQSNFEFIRDLGMVKVARLYKHGVKKVAKMFRNISLGLVRQYANSVTDPKVNDVEILLAAKQFATCYDYYMKEHAIAKDMLKEYRTYVFSGHILDQFLFNGYRPDNECVDYRKLPWKWF